MRRIKKNIVIIMMCVITFGLIGCGQKDYKFTMDLTKGEKDTQVVKVIISDTVQEPMDLTATIEQALNKSLEWYNTGKITAVRDIGDANQGKVLNGYIDLQSENYKVQIPVVFKNKKAYAYDLDKVDMRDDKSSRLVIESDEIKGVLDTVNQNIK